MSQPRGNVVKLNLNEFPKLSIIPLLNHQNKDFLRKYELLAHCAPYCPLTLDDFDVEKIVHTIFNFILFSSPLPIFTVIRQGTGQKVAYWVQNLNMHNSGFFFLSKISNKVRFVCLFVCLLACNQSYPYYALLADRFLMFLIDLCQQLNRIHLKNTICSLQQKEREMHTILFFLSFPLT